MSSLVSIVERSRASRDLAPLVASIPFARFLGISAAFAGEELIGKLAFAPHLVGNPLLPALHGGTIGALLESTAIFTLLVKTETLRVPKTITITIEFLRSGKAQDTFARAEFTRLGRRIASVRAFAWQDDPSRLIAAANASFLLMPVKDEQDATVADCVPR